MNKKLAVLLFCGLMGSLPALAQRYKTAAGIRLGGEEIGFTLQQKVWEKTTIEGIASAAPREIKLTALAQRHWPMLGQRFNYYLGAGAHGGRLKDYGAIYGFDGIMGIEYKINGLPFLLSGDIKPAFHVKHEEWFNLGAAFSIRYVLVKEKAPTPLEIIKGIFTPGKKKKKD
ncbi:hypothetical protein [Rufibacter sp. LB8]|uniref:hypothetical protein n=1 Tax=Rufibacter sp. LB8 TaxID=2777781 RepID=UPI00178C5426|nr:hypothetical protein [Rufibacter sp. LB8]